MIQIILLFIPFIYALQGSLYLNDTAYIMIAGEYGTLQYPYFIKDAEKDNYNYTSLYIILNAPFGSIYSAYPENDDKIKTIYIQETDYYSRLLYRSFKATKIKKTIYLPDHLLQIDAMAFGGKCSESAGYEIVYCGDGKNLVFADKIFECTDKNKVQVYVSNLYPESKDFGGVQVTRDHDYCKTIDIKEEGDI